MAIHEDKPKAFKDYFNRAAVEALAAQVRGAFARFDRGAFVARGTKGLEELELQARVKQVADALRETLPESVPRALKILEESLPPMLPDCEAVTDGWLLWPVGQFIADHGVPHFEESMEAMIALTQRFSSEFAVRPFVEQRPEETFERLYALCHHESPHVRRWCSEGCRPRLPWGKKLRALVADPTPIWPILEALRDDPELYVRRSVANNLNDITKDHGEAVIARCQQWMKPQRRKAPPEGRQWIVRHALRSLIKDGDPGALAVVGFGPPEQIEATLSVAPGRIAIGEKVELEATLRSRAEAGQKLAVDYAVHYVRKGDKRSAKVFKWKVLELAGGTQETLTKRHPMRVTTIRALYPGPHRVELQVNGQRLAEASFDLDPA